MSTKCRQFAFKGTNEKKCWQCPQKIQRNDRESVDRVSTKCRQFAFLSTNEKNIDSVRRKYKEMIGKMSTECRQNVDSLLSKPSTRQRGTYAVVGVATKDAPLQCVGYHGIVESNDQSCRGETRVENKLSQVYTRLSIQFRLYIYMVSDTIHACLDMDQGTLSFLLWTFGIWV